MSVIVWLLAGVLAYSLGALLLRQRGLLPDYLRVTGPITTVHTGRSRSLLERIGEHRRFWRAWGNFGLGVALVIMGAMFLVVITSPMRILQQPSATPIQNPKDLLVIPGVNQFLPLSVAPEIVVGLLLGMIVHEGGHGILSMTEDIGVESVGVVLLTVIPLGAFVEPNEDGIEAADRGARGRMFAAGVMNNFALTFVALLLLFGPVTSAIAVVPGYHVGQAVPGTPAAEAGLAQGDVITAVDGTAVTNESDLERVLASTDAGSVTVERDGADPITVDRQVYIERAVPEMLGSINTSGEAPPTVRAVNGTAVTTAAGFETAVDDRTVASIETDRGTLVIPIGAYVDIVQEDGPLADASVPTDADRLILTGIAGESVSNFEDAGAVLREIEPGTTVTVELFVDGDRREYEVTTAAAPDRPGSVLGIRGQTGYSGIDVADFGARPYPSSTYLTALGGESGPIEVLTDGNFLARLVSVLFFPLAGVLPLGQLSYNFAGFVAPVTNFYEVQGSLAPMGGGLYVFANVLFWTAWINLQLGLFNCIPTFPLDGGHLLRTGAESVVARLPVEAGNRLTTAVTVSISLVMVAGLFVMVFGPELLA